MGNYAQTNAFPLRAAQTRGGMSIGHHLLSPSPARGTHPMPGAYMPQAVPARDPGRRAAPSMRHKPPGLNPQTRGNRRKRDIGETGCLADYPMTTLSASGRDKQQASGQPDQTRRIAGATGYIYGCSSMESAGLQSRRLGEQSLPPVPE